MSNIETIDHHVAETIEVLKALIFIEQSAEPDELERLRGSIAAMLWTALDKLNGADAAILRSVRSPRAETLQ